MSSNSPVPIHGGILIGGASTRMGRPKHLLRLGGRTFVERLVELIDPYVHEIALLGSGTVPESCARRARLPDSDRARGPLAGMIAAFDSNQSVAWLLCACDTPALNPPAIEWLLEQRAPDHIAVLPRGPNGRIEPFPGVYEPGTRDAIGRLVMRGVHAPRRLADDAKVFTPDIPREFATAWHNVNTPDDLDAADAQT